MKIKDLKILNNINLQICSYLTSIPDGILEPTSLTNVYDEYFYSLYGGRKLSAYIKRLYVTSAKLQFGNEESEYSNIYDRYVGQTINTICKSTFRDKWKRLWDLWNKEYDALQPFDITLTETSSDKLDTIKDKSTYIDNDGVYGFNSTESVPSDKSTGSTDREYARDITRGRDYSRKGNIGNITKQELIRQEREVLQYKILDVIFKDIASIMCRASFGN